MNLGSILSRAARYFNNRCAFVCSGESRTFSEIEANSNRVANGLLKLGMCKGDRVAIVCDNSVQYVELDYAIYKAGLVRVAVNPMLSAMEVAHIIKDCGAATVVVSPRLANLVVSCREELVDVKDCISVSCSVPGMIEYEKLLENPETYSAPWPVEEADMSMLFYTGGTTGVPKGAIHTHKSIISVLMNLQAEFWRLTEKDVFLSGGSLAHANGFRSMTCYLQGAQFIIPDHFDAEDVLKTVEKEKVTIVSTVPTTLIRLCSYPDIAKFDLGSLRMITYGAAPIAVERLKDALRIFGKRLTQSYGQAEALMAISRLTTEDHCLEGSEMEMGRLACHGRPYTTNDVRVVDANDRDVPVGEIGEVIIRGPNMMQGYWKKPEATAETLKGGFVHTGDLGRMDEGGYLYLVDRKKDMIISGGYNIYAREVEDVVHAHPAVLEAAVIGVPDDVWGESVKAVVVLKEGMQATEEEIIQFTKERLASFKKPKSVDFVSKLPRTAAGKTSKKDLRAPFWVGKTRAIN